MSENVRSVFLLRRQKPNPQDKKFHSIQVKSKGYTPLAYMNTEEASCIGIFLPPPKYYYLL